MRPKRPTASADRTLDVGRHADVAVGAVEAGDVRALAREELGDVAADPARRSR